MAALQADVVVRLLTARLLDAWRTHILTLLLLPPAHLPSELWGPAGWCMAEQPKLECHCMLDGAAPQSSLPLPPLLLGRVGRPCALRLSTRWRVPASLPAPLLPLPVCRLRWSGVRDPVRALLPESVQRAWGVQPGLLQVP